MGLFGKKKDYVYFIIINKYNEILLIEENGKMSLPYIDFSNCNMYKQGEYMKYFIPGVKQYIDVDPINVVDMGTYEYSKRINHIAMILASEGNSYINKNPDVIWCDFDKYCNGNAKGNDMSLDVLNSLIKNKYVIIKDLSIDMPQINIVVNCGNTRVALYPLEYIKINKEGDL